METEDNIHKQHRKRMKSIYLKFGLEAFSDVEKLEFLLFYAIGRKDTNPLAHRLLKEFGSIDRVLEAPIDELKNIEGMGDVSAMLIHLVFSLVSAYGAAKNIDKIQGTETAKKFALNLLRGKSVEEFYVVCLSSNNKILATKLISVGTKSEVPVSISRITKAANSVNCERIILLHNHPVGEARPSDEDLSFTIKIILACILNDIEVIDHIVTNTKDAFSFEAAGILSTLKINARNRVPGTEETKSKFSSTSSNYVVGK